jgi:hypothetical protein
MLRRVRAFDVGRRGGLLVALAFVGCGGGDDVDCKMVTAMTAPPASATVVSLSTDQRELVCDLTACQNGGYGHQRSCPSGPSVTFAASRGQCLSQWPTSSACRATVKDLTDCMAAVSASPCTSTLLTSSACDAVTQFECLTFRPAAAVGMAVAATPGPR